MMQPIPCTPSFPPGRDLVHELMRQARQINFSNLLWKIVERVDYPVQTLPSIFVRLEISVPVHVSSGSIASLEIAKEDID